MPERPLREELAEGVRTPGFRNAVARQLVMLAGVFVLGWSPIEIAIFFLLEAFLFLSLRAAAEITLEPRFGVQATSAPGFAWEFAKHWLVAAVFMAVLVGGFGVFAVFPAFSGESRISFIEDGMLRPSFIVGLTLLAGSLVFDTALFARRVAAGRSPEDLARDDHGIRAALANVFLLAMASFWIGIAASLGLGPQVFVLGVAAVRLYVEAAPHRATKMFRPPGK
jgi:hypothetical protein